MHTTVRQVNFKEASVRHYTDALALESQGRNANAGQLYGFTAECGLKALLVAHGVPTEPNGDIQTTKPNTYRKHMPSLGQVLATITTFPDGRAATRYISMLPDIANFADWSIEHRYWADVVLPSASLPKWKEAATQIQAMLDAATIDGVL